MDTQIKFDICKTDWDCIDSDTRYLTHGIHRYSGKFIPQIAKQAINYVTKPGDLVLDPYCGSGTTLLECCLSGRRSIGIDLNPLAVLISRVKTNVVSKEKLAKFQSKLERKIEPIEHITASSGGFQLDLFRKFSDTELSNLIERVQSDWRWSEEWYVKWFHKDRLSELIAIFSIIIKETDLELKNIALLAFSDILRVSSNAHSSYPNVMFDKNKKIPSSVLPKFRKRLKEIIHDIMMLDGIVSSSNRPSVCLSDACSLPIPDNVINAVITHPPYIGSIPYAEYGALSLKWLGHNPKELDQKLTGGMRQSKYVVNHFNKGFKMMIFESYRVLKKGGILFMLLGNPVVKGNRVDLVEMAKRISNNAGFNLSVNQNRNGINRRANLMSRESLLFFEK